jgi:hypothetical protein
VARCCECDDEPSGSGATELASLLTRIFEIHILSIHLRLGFPSDLLPTCSRPRNSIFISHVSPTSPSSLGWLATRVGPNIPVSTLFWESNTLTLGKGRKSTQWVRVAGVILIPPLPVTKVLTAGAQSFTPVSAFAHPRTLLDNSSTYRNKPFYGGRPVGAGGLRFSRQRRGSGHRCLGVARDRVT